MAADKLEINRKRHICSMCEIDELGAKEEEEHFGECKNADVSDPTTNAYNAYIIQKIQIKFQTADLFVSSRLNMFRNQYDSDVTVWSPQGRLHQVEYAMEAVKLGSATVGLKGRDHAVLVALKRASSELASYQKKIIPIDSHLGISIAGITADARVLSRHMRQECLNYKYSNDTVYPVSRLIQSVGNKMQSCTQRYDRRPYGVGLLVAGYDDQGPQLFEVLPSANFFSCKSMSIGARSQSARTYLEKHLSAFAGSTKEELIKHGLEALRGTLPNEDLLTKSNISIGVVGKDEQFHILSDEENQVYVSSMERRVPGGAAAEPAAPADDAPAGDDMETH